MFSPERPIVVGQRIFHEVVYDRTWTDLPSPTWYSVVEVHVVAVRQIDRDEPDSRDWDERRDLSQSSSTDDSP